MSLTLGSDISGSLNPRLKNYPLHVKFKKFRLRQDHLSGEDNILDEPTNNLTLFAPHDDVFLRFVNSAKANFWMVKQNVLTMLRFGSVRPETRALFFSVSHPSLVRCTRNSYTCCTQTQTGLSMRQPLSVQPFLRVLDCSFASDSHDKGSQSSKNGRD